MIYQFRVYETFPHCVVRKTLRGDLIRNKTNFRIFLVEDLFSLCVDVFIFISESLKNRGRGVRN